MKSQLIFLYLPCAFLAPITAAEKSFQDYILAPTSRVISPVAIHQTGGNVENAAGLLTINGADGADFPNAGSTTFSGNGSYVTLDFGKNIAGRVGFQVDAVSGTSDSIGFTFSESSMYISAQFCDSVQPEQFDMPQWFNNTAPGYYQADHEFQRGAFRYLTVVHNSTGTISLSNVTVYWTTSPEMADPAAYKGYFHSDSEKLNRVWRPICWVALQYYHFEAGMSGHNIEVLKHGECLENNVPETPDVAGLQIKTSSGEWKFVPPIDNGVVCNVGDTLDFWSAGYFKSTTHRVVRPPEDQAHLSVRDFSTLLGLVKADAENSEPVTGLQYVRERVKNYHQYNDYADMKGKKCNVGNLEIEVEAD
ncbi:hypothetical protein K4K56_003170 [Colletotrichum sp. SAR 10_98]|nr:hypothetical protein K4K56_003170 [Colletotrichum sp. SAR 10_98]